MDLGITGTATGSAARKPPAMAAQQKPPAVQRQSAAQRGIPRPMPKAAASRQPSAPRSAAAQQIQVQPATNARVSAVARRASAGNRVSAAMASQQQPEEKKQVYGKPSDRLQKIKVANPFGASTRKHKTNFGYAYGQGQVPCRINHGCNQNKLQWDQEVETVDFDPFLVNCFEGLQETDHPYQFVAMQALREMLQSQMADQKVAPIVSKLILPLRQGLISRDSKIWSNSIEATQLLAQAARENLVPHLHLLMGSFNSKMANKLSREKVTQTLNVIESCGGPDALKVIKQKIPAYVSMQ